MLRRVLLLLGLVAAGLVLGVLCAAAALLVVGMGHGWELPFTYAPLALLLYPVALVRLGWVRPDIDRRVEVVAIWVGAVVVAMLLLGLHLLPPAPARPLLEWLVVGLVAALLAGCWPVARRLAPRGLHPVVADILLLVLGLGLDLGAVVMGVSSYQARIAAPFVGLWALLWLGWQALVVAALVRHVRDSRRAAAG